MKGAETQTFGRKFIKGNYRTCYFVFNEYSPSKFRNSLLTKRPISHESRHENVTRKSHPDYIKRKTSVKGLNMISFYSTSTYVNCATIYSYTTFAPTTQQTYAHTRAPLTLTYTLNTPSPICTRIPRCFFLAAASKNLIPLVDLR